ncbi:MAG TPA: cyanophycinase [Thermoanaerobaculia bacterium]
MIGNGCVIAIGGNEDKTGEQESILAAFVERAGSELARIVVIPSASEEPLERARTYGRIFRELGAADVRAVHAERGVVTAEEREAIRNATGIFVTGGSQGRLMDALRETDCIEVIRETVRAGAVYAGTSAGASAASATMIAGSNDGEILEEMEFGEGLGLIPDVIIDQHFSERGRLPRLIASTAAYGMTGVGIDENTAIVWTGPGEALVKGTGAVTVLDLTNKLHILKDGAKIRF